jgi:hypothetical protein
MNWLIYLVLVQLHNLTRTVRDGQYFSLSHWHGKSPSLNACSNFVIGKAVFIKHAHRHKPTWKIRLPPDIHTDTHKIDSATRVLCSMCLCDWSDCFQLVSILCPKRSCCGVLVVSVSYGNFIADLVLCVCVRNVHRIVAGFLDLQMKTETRRNYRVRFDVT